MTAAEVWDEFQEPLAVRLSRDLQELARNYDEAADRSQQTDLGPSEIGDPCSKCLAGRILGVWEYGAGAYDDGWRAWVGTAIHARLEAAAAYANAQALNEDRPARWWPEQTVHPDPALLPSGGHADLYDEVTRTVVDWKTCTKAKLQRYRDGDIPVIFRHQIQLYGLGYANAGAPVENVALAFWPRDGMYRDLWIHVEPYDEAVALKVLERYGAVRGLCGQLGAEAMAVLPSDPDCSVCSR